MAVSRKAIVREGGALLVVIALVTFARSSLADHYYIPSGSMEYTLLPGDRVIIDKTAYGFRIPLTTIDLFGARGPERGDIAVFDSPTDGTRLIKRVVAIGGDIVELHDGLLRINGIPLRVPDNATTGLEERFEDRSASLNLSSGGGPDIDGLLIPEGHVLMLGDHRGNSRDGRYFGTIDERALFGRAIAVYFRRDEGFVWEPL